MSPFRRFLIAASRKDGPPGTPPRNSGATTSAAVTRTPMPHSPPPSAGTMPRVSATRMPRLVACWRLLINRAHRSGPS